MNRVGTLLVDQLAEVTTVLDGEEARARCQVEGIQPAVVALPATEAEVAACLKVAATHGAAVCPRGGGTRMGLGGPLRQCDVVLSLERLAGVVEYVPEDLTVTVQAGMSLAALEELVAGRNQEVPLDPMGSADTTVGGILAAGAVGPRRMLYGGPRDVLLGAQVALADGRLIRSGGRVVKNVAGYDLNKLWVGSLGTLGVLTEVTLKLRPKPACRRTLCFAFGDLGQALQAAEAVLGSELLPAAVTLLSPGAAARLGLPAWLALIVELAESESNVAYQAGRLKEILSGCSGRLEEILVGSIGELGDIPAGRRGGPEVSTASRPGVLQTDPEKRFWLNLRDFYRIDDACWRVRVSTVLSDLAELMRLAMSGPGVDVIAHVGSGSLFVYGKQPDPRIAAALQNRAAALGGAAVLEEAPPEMKQQVDVWGPPRSEWRLMRQIKERLDPGGVLNPGRFVGGI